jgi:SAM-dependent methyltransferase
MDQRWLDRRAHGVTMNAAGHGMAVTRTVCISMVKNEQDIIEPFLRHNSAFFDTMILLDNGSADHTRAIALDVAREIGSIFVTDLRRKAYDQGEIMSRALAFVQGAVFADFALFLDADEFLIAPSPDDFHRSLEAIDPGATALLPWRTYLPDPEALQDDCGDVLHKFQWRRVRERPKTFKIALRLGGMTDPRFKVAQGSHSASGPTGASAPKHRIGGVHIAHLPVRSRGQVLSKGVIGWRANLARTGERRGQAVQWKRLHDLYFDPSRSATLDLSHEAMIYAQKKPYATWEANAVREEPPISALRKYSDGRPANPDLLIAASEVPGDTHPARLTVAARNQDKATTVTDITNAFNAAWHWRKQFLDVAPFANLFETHQPKSVLDVGCGHGLYLDIARQCGAKEILGIDGMDRSGTALRDGEYLRLDLQEKQDLGRKFDLVLCLEVVEHIRPDATATLFDSIATHAAGPVLFSMAEPGQPGHGHINCRPMTEVLDLWQERGWWPDLGATLGFRSLATLCWFRRNVVLLRNARRATSEAESAALKHIASRPHRWYGQQPGVRFAAFEEDYPPITHAYNFVPRRRRTDSSSA